MVNLHTLAR